MEMAKEGAHRGFLPFLNRMEKETARRLLEFGDIETKKRLRAITADLAQMQNEILTQWSDELERDLDDLAIEQAFTEAEGYEKVIADYKSAVPAQAKIVAAYKTNPMTIADYTGNQLLIPFLKDFNKQTIQRYRNEITSGYYRGESISTIYQAIIGSDATIKGKVQRHIRTIIRTAYQHVAQSAKEEVQRANLDIIKGYKWLATLDSKTSSSCRALDGREFKLGKGPRPPIHPNCRSTTVMVLKDEFAVMQGQGKRGAKGAKGGETISEKTTYYAWLKRQPAKFQDKVLGPENGKLFRGLKIDANKFSELSLDKNFRPISMTQLKASRPDIFEE